MVWADSHGIPRVPWYLGNPLRGRLSFAYGAVTLCGRPFQDRSAKQRLCNSLSFRQKQPAAPTTPSPKRLPPITRRRFGLVPFRSPLLREFLFLQVLRCFSSLGALYPPYIFRRESHDITHAGFPHSDISGSKLVSSSPKRFVGNHVLHRLSMPRHPPCALRSLTYLSPLHSGLIPWPVHCLSTDFRTEQASNT